MQNSDKLDLIIEILKRHDKQFDHIDQRFDQSDKRFDQIDKKFDQIDRRLDHLEEDNRWIKEKIFELWESRKEVTVKFSRNWAWQNMFYSGGISIAVFVVGFLLFAK